LVTMMAQPGKATTAGLVARRTSVAYPCVDAPVSGPRLKPRATHRSRLEELNMNRLVLAVVVCLCADLRAATAG
jgi:hypothetical protein